MTIEEIEKELRKDAQELVKQEPLSRLMLEEQVLNRKDFADMLAVTLACQLAGEVIDRTELEKIFSELYVKHPELLDDAIHDLRATVLRDPACTGYLEPLLLFKGFLPRILQAFLWKKQLRRQQPIRSCLNRFLEIKK